MMKKPSRIRIELVGGPDDGETLDIDRHRYQWLMPRATAPGVLVHETIPDEIARAYVSVYRRVEGTSKYVFSGVEPG
jgi:hypothetical protein